MTDSPLPVWRNHFLVTVHQKSYLFSPATISRFLPQKYSFDKKFEAAGDLWAPQTLLFHAVHHQVIKGALNSSGAPA